MNLFDSKKKLGIAGVVMGLVAATLAYFGNPANMAICIACFVRDTAGALGLHSAEPVQYARPEIIGIVLGAFIISIATKEYRATAGSSTIVRFVLGMILVIGALVFLGCPLRMVIRMSAGDLNAWVALIGFVLGIATGVFALKKGFSLGRAHVTNKVSGSVLPLLMIGVLVLALGTNLLKSSTAGPGSMHAPIIISLIGGLLFGAFAQKSRMCFAGSIRDIILMKNFDLITIIVGFFAVMLVYNIATGHFVLAFNTPGVIAHSQHLWSILGMYAVGFAAVLAGGCPLRQLVLAGQGSSDAGVTVIGMFAGGALAHNLGLAASGTALNAETGEIVAGAVPPAGKIAAIICIIDEMRAAHQDIRPISIGLLNLMPLKEDTELQILRALSNSPLQVDVTFVRVTSHVSKNTSTSHIYKFYEAFDDIKDKKFDGFIITGAPVEQMPFEDVDYWEELKRIMEWTKTNVVSTLHLCWGAQAGIYYHYGIDKVQLPEKRSGLFWHHVRNRKIPIVRGFDDKFLAPHSRHTEVPQDLLEKDDRITILADSEEAGVYLCMAQDGRQIFVMGHPEYDRMTLDSEYKRDLGKGLNPQIPENYYPNDDPEKKPMLSWRAHCNNLYTNWLNYYVYQVTPYDLYGTPF